MLAGLACAVLLATTGPGRADLAYDGSLRDGAPRFAEQAGDITDSWVILQSEGLQQGENLFYSFSRFDVDTGHTAYFFRESSLPPVHRVLARITGGPSTVLGQVLSGHAADLFLLNPSGMLFGPGSSVDVAGSLYVSSADVLRFGDGVPALETGTAGAVSPLLTAAPTAFGFLGPSAPAPVELSGARWSHPLSGSHVALLGGSLALRDSVLATPTASQFLGAVVRGEVDLRGDSPDLDGVELGGRIELERSVLSTAGVSPLGNVRLPGSGDIVIRGAELHALDSDIAANTRGAADGGDIRIDLDGALHLERRDEAGVGIFAFSQLDDPILPAGAGSSGDVRIRAASLSLLGGARVSTGAFGAGSAGRVEIDVTGRALFSGRDPDPARRDTDRSGVFLTTEGGPAGRLELRADELILDDFGAVVAQTQGAESGGSIEVDVRRLALSGGARLDSSTRGAGDAGDIRVRASELVRVSGAPGGGEFSGITALAQPESTGAPGSIAIETPRLEVSDGGQIATTALGERLVGDPQRDARVGNIDIELGGDGALSLERRGTVSARSQGPRGAGSISVRGAARIELSGGAAITGEARDAADGGSIDLQARDLLSLDGAAITSSVNDGTGGNITIDPEFVILRNGAIVAEAGAGTGGNIDITARHLFRDARSRISASSRSGVDGTVVIRSPDVDLAGELAGLPASFVDASRLLVDHCAARGPQARGSFVARLADTAPELPVSPLRPSRHAPALPPGVEASRAARVDAAREATRRGEHALALARWTGLAADTAGELRGHARLGIAQAQQALGRRRAAHASAAAGLAALPQREGALAAALLAVHARTHADPARALEELTRAQTLADGDATTRVRIVLDRAAVQASRDPEAALDALHQAARLAATLGATALRGQVELRLGLAGGEAATLERARRALLAAPANHETLLDLLTLARHDPARAPALLEQVRQRAEALGDARALSHARGELGALHARAGRPVEALTLTRRALRAAARAEAPAATYLWLRQAGRLHLEADRLDEAVETLESARRVHARSYAGVLDEHGVLDLDGLLEELVDARLRRAARTEDPGRRERDLLAARDRMDDRTAAAFRDYFHDECVATQRFSSPENVPGAVVVYPVLLEDRTELIISSARGTRAVLVDARTPEILEQARALARWAQVSVHRRYLRPAGQLYEWLVRPVEQELGATGAQTLVFVPTGALRSVPLAALWDADSGTHLVERHPLAVVPGLTLSEPRPFPRDVRLLSAGLTLPVQGYPALPAVGAELAAIGDHFAGSTLLDEAFVAPGLEAALRGEAYGALHIASHAEFGGDSEQTFVVTYDDRLRATQLGDLVELTRFRDEPLELLALSACETAAGDERAALGLAGLAARSGARSVLATLWPVGDAAAARLVAAFYRELARAGTSRAQALRRAQLTSLADVALHHPAHWSSFIMIGNWL